MSTEETNTVPKLKASTTRRVSSIDLETLRATVEHAITRFEHVIDANECTLKKYMIK